MAELIAFHYQPRNSAAHRFDARFKLPLFLLLVAVTIHSDPAALLVLSLFVLAAIVISRLPAGRIARDFRLFALLLAVMFVARSLSHDAGAAAAPATGSATGEAGFLLALSPTEVAAAGVLVWRLALLVVLGSILAATTRASQLQAAIAWYLRPFPFIPGGRIATMVGLTISLIPLIFDSYREISDAQAARCGAAVRNPVRRLRRLAVPLLLKTFGRADGIGAAMEARCYTDRRSFAPLSCRRADWATGAAVAAVALAALAAGGFL